MNWQEYYKNRTVSADYISRMVKPEDFVFVAQNSIAKEIGPLLEDRRDELEGLRIAVGSPWLDFGWYKPSQQGKFKLEVAMVLPIVIPLMDEGHCDYMVPTITFEHNVQEEPPDFLIVEVSPPDLHGYCSLGVGVWNKKDEIETAKLVVAEVNEDGVRTRGTSVIHVSDVDYSVLQTVRTEQQDIVDARSAVVPKVTDAERQIAGYVSTLIKDGDTIEIGVRGPAEIMPQLGAFEGKHDIGVHTEVISAGLVGLVENGIITGKRKKVNRGRIVCTGLNPNRRVIDFARTILLWNYAKRAMYSTPWLLAAMKTWCP